MENRNFFLRGSIVVLDSALLSLALDLRSESLMVVGGCRDLMVDVVGEREVVAR